MSESPFDKYLDLTDAERAALHAHVVAHPAEKGDLAAVELIERMVGAVGALHRQPLTAADDTALRYLLYTRMLQDTPVSPLAPLWQAMDERAAVDEVFRAHLDDLRAELVAQSAGAVDAVAQFERLSGHRLGAGESASPPRPRQDRGPRRQAVARQRRPWQWAVAAVVGLCMVYAALLGVSQTTTSSVQRLALLGTEALGDPATGPTRGAIAIPPNEAVTTDELFRQATRMVRHAERAPLGLFPRYDADSLALSIQTLEAILSREEAGSFYIGQAYFVLAQAYLLQDDPQAAEEALEAALRNGTQSATLAQEQLDALRR